MSKKFKKKSSIKVSTSRKIFLICNNIFLIGFALVCLIPFINLFAISLSSAAANDAGSVGLIPIGFNISAYEALISKNEFWRAFGISVERVVLGTIISLAINVLAAYPLSRPKNNSSTEHYMFVYLLLLCFLMVELYQTLYY